MTRRADTPVRGTRHPHHTTSNSGACPDWSSSGSSRRGGARAGRGSGTSVVPPHSLVAAERPQSAGQDRAGAALAREHPDDTEHLHAGRRHVAPKSSRLRSASCSKCSQIGRIEPIRENQ